MRSELCSWSNSLTKRSFCRVKVEKGQIKTLLISDAAAAAFCSTNPKVGGSKAVGRGHVGAGGGVGVEGVDVGQQGAHHRGNAGTHVLGRQAGEVSEDEKDSLS